MDGTQGVIIVGSAAFANRKKLDALRRAVCRLGGPGLVQPLIPEIPRAETSFVFIDGDFTHAVGKTPTYGKISGQSDHGGTFKSFSPPAFAVDGAVEILEMPSEKPVYARVDAIILDDWVILMEVELIEPELFSMRLPPRTGSPRRRENDRNR